MTTALRGLRLLEGIRVVSVEQYISGPYATSILADAGAEVIKIERPGVGDPRRSYEPRVGPADDYISGGFASYNRGKRSVELDLGSAADLVSFRALLGDADVLLSNIRPGSLSGFGLTIERLREDFPRLVICEISGFGTSGGPYASWPAFDSVIQAMSGLSSLIGPDADAPPALAPMGTMDMLAGVYATIGILSALVSRARTGNGCHIDAAMYDIGASFLERPLTLHEFSGQIPTRGIDRFSPVGVFRAGDGGWTSIVIPTDEMWRRCCNAIGQPELADDPRLDTTLKRADAMTSVVVPVLEAWAANKTREEAVAALREAGQPAGIVQSIDQVRACPHLAYRGLFTEMIDERAERPDGTHPTLPHLPLLIDGRSPVPGAVPRLGEDNSLIDLVRSKEG